MSVIAPALSGRRPEMAELLGLRPHEEGGWYRETWKTARETDYHPPGYGGMRAAASGIYYFLEAREESCWHAVLSDEVWLWHRGGPLTISLAGDGPAPDTENATSIVLGPAVEEGQHPQFLVPARHWQAARPEGRDVLVSCIVAPSFHYDDFLIHNDGENRATN